MNVIDTSAEMLSAYESGHFCLEKWEEYMDRYVPGAKELNLAEMRETVAAGYSWEEEFLPVLDWMKEASRMVMAARRQDVLMKGCENAPCTDFVAGCATRQDGRTASF